MKNKQKFIAVVMSIVLLIPCFSLCFSAYAASNVPIVYVQGQGDWLIDAEGEVIYRDGRFPIEDGMIKEMVSEVMPLLISAFAFGEWEEYRNTFLSYWAPIYEKAILDKNGEPSNGTHKSFTWSYNSLTPGYTLGSYLFTQDWRLDPFDNAVELKAFIDAVRAKTGSQKVNLVGRCEGANVVMAYCEEYGFDAVNNIEFYIPALYGNDAIGALFAGDLYFDPVLIRQVVDSNVTVEDDGLAEMLNAALDYLVDSFGFEGACKFLENKLPVLYRDLMVDVLLTSYGTFPGFWAMVGSQYYDQAMATVFNGREDEYAGLIAKLNNYDAKVRTRIPEIIADGQSAGVKFANFAKYNEGINRAPICRERYELTDGATCIRYNALGATSVKNKSEQFSDKYLASADPNYISPDKRIDMSTGLLRDTTWICYNVDHNVFDEGTNRLMTAWFNSDGEMTVFTDPAYPQYMTLENGTIRPMVAEDVPEGTISTDNDNIISRIKRVLQSIAALFRLIFDYLKNMSKNG